MLKVFGRRSAFNVQKVLWLVGELGLEHQHVDRGGAAGGLDAPAFLAMNPHGRVPVLDDNGTIVWESHAILRYLAARYGPGRFWAEDAGERSMADRWMDWAQTSLQPDFMTLFWALVRTPEAQRDAARIERAARRCAAHFELLDRWLAPRPWLGGGHFSLADIPAGATLFRYFAMPVPRSELPHIDAWYTRLQARTPYRTHIMRPFDELRGRLDY